MVKKDVCKSELQVSSNFNKDKEGQRVLNKYEIKKKYKWLKYEKL